MIAWGRSSLKSVGQRFLVALGVPAIYRALRSPRDVVLAYHNVVPVGSEPGGDTSLHLSREDFARHLDLLTRTHRVVPLEDLFPRGEGDNRGDGRPRAALTFDDGYRGALTAGLEELAARDLPATYFVAPGLLGRDGLWWDELAGPESGRKPAVARREAIEEDSGKTENVYARARTEGWTRTRQPRHAGVVTEDELRAATAKHEAVRLGSHGWSHPNLARLGKDELREELERSLAWLRDRFEPVSIPWLSLPYGYSGPELEDLAREVGYDGVVRIREGGLVGDDTSRFAVPRVNVPAGLTEDGLRLRVAGLW